MSNNMTQWLAQIYGTDGADDIEKTAEAMLLNKLAQDQNLDLSQFSPEELQQLLAEVLGEEEGQAQMGAVPGAALQQAQQLTGVAPQAPQAPVAPVAQQQAPQFSAFAPAAQAQQQAPSQESLMKEAQAKFEEADLLGRVMAHAYTQELEKIASMKTAGRFDGAKSAVRGAVASVKNRAGHMADRAGAKARSYGTAAGMKGRDAAGRAGNFAKKNKGAIGAGAAAAAGGFAAGRMSKEASAFEKLAEMQAAEILGAAGFDPATGTDLYAQQEQQTQEQVQPFLAQGQEQQAAGELNGEVGQEDFQSVLDNRALEMLAEAGYNVEEIVARLQQAGQS